MVGTKSRVTRIRAGCQRASTRWCFSAPVPALLLTEIPDLVIDLIRHEIGFTLSDVELLVVILI